MSASTSNEADPGSAVARRRVTVLNPPGLHARPASVLAGRAQAFKSEVSLVLVSAAGQRDIDEGTRVDAKSVLDIIVLGAAQGTTIDVEADGPDAEEAATAIAQLFNDQFGME